MVEIVEYTMWYNLGWEYMAYLLPRSLYFRQSFLSLIVIDRMERMSAHSFLVAVLSSILSKTSFWKEKLKMKAKIQRKVTNDVNSQRQDPLRNHLTFLCHVPQTILLIICKSIVDTIIFILITQCRWFKGHIQVVFIVFF